MDERFIDGPPVNCLLVTFDQAQCRLSAGDVATALAEGDPRIVAVHEGTRIGFVTDVLSDAEAAVIGERLRALLKA